LVVFVGGGNFSVGQGAGVAWFPLGPREIYHPAYAVSQRYFENVNRSNTLVDKRAFVNAYNRPPESHEAYVNRRVPGAIVAVPASTFVESRSVSRAAVWQGRELPAGAAFAPTLAPTTVSVHGAAGPGGKPPGRVFERNLVAHAAPPPGQAGFAVQQKQLQERPGRPLADAQRQALPNREALVAPVVKLFRGANGASASPRSSPPPLAPPPAALATVTPIPAPPARPDQRSGREDQRRLPTPPTRANAAAVAAPVASAPGRDAAGRAPLVAPSPAPAQAPAPAPPAAPARALPPAATPAPPPATSPPPPPRDANAEQRSRGFRRGNGDQGAAAAQPPRPVEPPRPVAAPPANPPAAVQARPTRPQPGAAVAPAPVTAPTPAPPPPPPPPPPPATVPLLVMLMAN
jgi:hypothetical protein